MPTLALRLCGDVTLTADAGAPTHAPLGSKTLALLAYLAIEPGPHRREQLTTLLWGEYPEEKAKASLRQALTHLRETLADALRIDRATVELVGPLTCDVTEFTRLSAQDPAAALDIDIPRFLSSLAVRNSPAFEEWVDEKRIELRGRYAKLLAKRVRDCHARHAWRDVQRLAQRWSGLDPLADEPIVALMEAQYLDGDRDTALATYARHASRLATEARRAPSRALVELAARFERATPTSSPARRATEGWYHQAPSFNGSLVGRRREWESMTKAWAAVVGGTSRVVIIEGEPGAGKSRLADDFLRWVTSEGGVVLRGRGYDSPSAPFGAVIEALQCALDAPGLAGVDPEWLAEVARVLPALRKRFPGLQDVGAVNGNADSWRLFEAVAQLLLALAEENPIAILVDDIQWCDADSCALVHFLVRRLADVRVLWCATFTLGEVERDAPAARLGRALRSGRGASSITLAPLTEGDVWNLIRELGRVDAPNGGRRLAARIHEITAGNPFYVIELLKTLFAQELLTVDPATGAWIVPSSASANAVWPVLAPTVHDAVAERIECLPDQLHAVLISVALAGRGCRTDVLSHLHGISRLHAAMLGDALVERHLVTEEEGVYRCSHPTIAHVVRGRLTTSRRREVHRALAIALETLLPATGADPADVGEIAGHADQAGDAAMTYRYALRASEAAGARCAYDEALSWLDLAAGAAATSEESAVVDRTTEHVLKQAGWREAPPARTPLSPIIRQVEQADFDLPAELANSK